VDLQHGRTVAIKVMRPEYMADREEDRFVREIETAASLNHPHIVPLYDSGVVSGRRYYVMPFVEGESLRQRIDREHMLPVEEAVLIVRQVGEALQYAHHRGILHRDVKPSNVLLTEGGALLADFGIAKLLEADDVEPVTRTGLVIGSPGYMSPEQASGEPHLDGRCDQYSLACLLFEMLAGEPSFDGPTPQSRISKQLAQPVPSVRVLRETVSTAMDEALRKAMAKAPADRFASVTEFLDALVAESPERRSRRYRLGVRRAGWVVPVILAMAFGTWRALQDKTVASNAGIVPDTSVYAVFPFAGSREAPQELYEVQRLEDALDDWDGLALVSQLQLTAPLAEIEDGLTIEAAARIAGEHGAGRFIWGQIEPLGNSLSVRAFMYDSGSNGAQLADYAFRLTSIEQADSLFQAMALHLLFRGDPPAGEPYSGSNSLPAVKELRRGLAALERWDLGAADAAFHAARTQDPEYARANAWLAVVRSWRGRPVTDWELAADQAVRNGSQLSESERTAAEATRAVGRGDFEHACPLWQSATQSDPASHIHWYGLAHCLTVDSMVVRDPASPSGWAFRTSWNQAFEAVEEAFRIRPAILGSFQRSSYQPVQELFMVGGNQRRGGWSESMRFTARPVWQGDTLAFVPYPRVLGSDPLPTGVAAVGEAVRELRLRLVRIAQWWSSQEPRNGQAKHTLGLALALMGDPSAVDTLRVGRTLALEPDDRNRIAASEVWVQLSMAFPDNAVGVSRAKALADSLLADTTVAGGLAPELAVGLASLTGRASLAARLARTAARQAATSPDEQFNSSFSVPGQLSESAPALLVFSALGGPPDSLLALERMVTRAIEDRLPPAQREQAKYPWLIWPASQAFPFRFAGASDLPKGDPLFTAQNAWFEGDTTAVLGYLEASGAQKLDILPFARTLDTLYPEAYLWWLLSEPARAAAWLDPTLGSLPQVHPSILALPPNSGALVRGAALRAQLAAAMGFPEEAAVWARAVTTLWSDADEFQRHTVVDMQSLLE
jgi:hypothetical protein